MRQAETGKTPLAVMVAVMVAIVAMASTFAGGVAVAGARAAKPAPRASQKKDAAAAPGIRTAAVWDDVAGKELDGELPREAEPTTPLTVEHDPQILSHGEMLSLARKFTGEIADALLDGERARAEAVRQRDAIKLACIQDRLAGMKTSKMMADERLAATERPSIRADELNLRHEYRGVELAHGRVMELRRQLLECVGESLEVSGPDPKSQAPSASANSNTDPSGTNIEIPRMERPMPASPTS